MVLQQVILPSSAGDDKTASDGTPFASVASGDHAVGVSDMVTLVREELTLAQGLYNIVKLRQRRCCFRSTKCSKWRPSICCWPAKRNNSEIVWLLDIRTRQLTLIVLPLVIRIHQVVVPQVAMGDTCEANGTSSTAMGYKTKATGAYSSTIRSKHSSN